MSLVYEEKLKEELQKMKDEAKENQITDSAERAAGAKNEME